MKILTINELLDVLSKYNHTELHVHHTANPNKSSFNGSNHIKLQENMKNAHIKGNGWNDIGQHVTLFPDGKFVTGRDFNVPPASIKGYNGSAGKVPFAVETLGNFTFEKLEGAQLQSLVDLAKYFHKQKKYIRFHNENNATACPAIDKKWFMSLVEQEKVPFADIVGHTGEQDIRELMSLGIMNGFPDGTFRPDEALTRAQLAMVLNRFRKSL